eukprot:s2782_g9.t1
MGRREERGGVGGKRGKEEERDKRSGRRREGGVPSYACRIHGPTGEKKGDCSGHCRISSASHRLQWAVPDLKNKSQIAVGTAGPQLHVPDPSGTAGPQSRVPDPSGHCRTSTASPRAQWALPDLNRDQWALPDLNRKLQISIAVGTAGLHLPAPDRSVPDLNREPQIPVDTAGPQPRWALPDLNRERQMAVGTGGPQCRTSTVSPRSQWALPDLNGE